MYKNEFLCSIRIKAVIILASIGLIFFTCPGGEAWAKRVVVRGSVVVKPPRGHRVVRVGGGTYYCYRGVFYQKRPKGYVVVRPPLGAVVVSLPVGYRRVTVGGIVYYHYDGIYYQKYSSGYVVVKAP